MKLRLLAIFSLLIALSVGFVFVYKGCSLETKTASNESLFVDGSEAFTRSKVAPNSEIRTQVTTNAAPPEASDQPLDSLLHALNSPELAAKIKWSPIDADLTLSKNKLEEIGLSRHFTALDAINGRFMEKFYENLSEGLQLISTYEGSALYFMPGWNERQEIENALLQDLVKLLGNEKLAEFYLRHLELGLMKTSRVLSFKEDRVMLVSKMEGDFYSLDVGVLNPQYPLDAIKESIEKGRNFLEMANSSESLTFKKDGVPMYLKQVIEN